MAVPVASVMAARARVSSRRSSGVRRVADVKPLRRTRVMRRVDAASAARDEAVRLFPPRRLLSNKTYSLLQCFFSRGEVVRVMRRRASCRTRLSFFLPPLECENAKTTQKIS